MSGHKQRILYRVTIICLTNPIPGKSHSLIKTNRRFVSHTHFQMNSCDITLCGKTDQTLHQKRTNAFSLSVFSYCHICNISLIQDHKKSAVTQYFFFLFYYQKHGIISGKKSKKTFFCPWNMKQVLLYFHYLIQVIYKHFTQNHASAPACFCAFSRSARSLSA